MRVTMCCFRVRLSGEGHRGARGREGIVMYKQARPHQKRRKRSGAEVREEGLVAARGLLLDRGPAAVTLANVDRKSTRLTPVTNAHLVCRLLLEKKNNTQNRS